MERDDIIEYSLDAGHSEEEGKAIRKRILFVTILLSAITTGEVLLGVFWRNWLPNSWHWIKWTFIVLTLVKATYIVMSFMHLGDERRNIRSMILLPYALFLMYLIFIAIWEANFVHETVINYL